MSTDGGFNGSCRNGSERSEEGGVHIEPAGKSSGERRIRPRARALRPPPRNWRRLGTMVFS
jgi:hypothetical protein